MRQYAWYSPELDLIVYQTFMENCYISFEWPIEGFNQLHEMGFNIEKEPMSEFLWFPLGEM